MNNKRSALFLTTIIVMLITFLLPAASYAYPGDEALTVGWQGNDVNQLQRDLNYLGYGSVDSMLGKQTQAAVLAFQKDNALNADGAVGKATANTLSNTVSSGSEATSPSRGFTTFSNQDIYDLARLVYGEARGEPYVGQVAVAAVAINRLESNKFANTLRGVIYEPLAFTAVSDAQFYLEPNASALQAAKDAIKGWDPTGGALYYWNPKTATSKWVWSRSIITQIGQHVFAG
jgi:N-acetylmuramoyl-L-alanine amidase